MAVWCTEKGFNYTINHWVSLGGLLYITDFSFSQITATTPRQKAPEAAEKHILRPKCFLV